MTKEQYKTHVGKLCCDKERPHILFMVFDFMLKNNTHGSCTPYYSYICLNTGHIAQAPCSHFFDNEGAGHYVRFLSASEV